MSEEQTNQVETTVGLGEGVAAINDSQENQAPNQEATQDANHTNQEATQDANHTTQEEQEAVSKEELERIVQARVGKAERLAQKREQQLLDLFQANQANQTKQPQAQAGIDLNRQPTLQDYNGDWEKYIDGLSTWKAVAAITIRDQQERQIVAQRAEEERKSNWVKKVRQVEQVYPDFQEVMNDHLNTQVPTDVLAFVEDSDIGPALSYHLAMHPEIVEEVNKSSFSKRQKLLMKIESQLEPKFLERNKGTVQTTNKAVSKAPAPMSNVKGSNAASGSLYDPAVIADPQRFKKIMQDRYLAKIGKLN